MRKLLNIAMVIAILLSPFLVSAEEGSLGLILYVPVVINCLLMAIFGYSLLWPPTVAERMARRWRSDLPVEVISYCWWVTMIWIMFFALNGLFSLFTVLSGNISLWSLYNGVIAYLLIAVLFAGELTYRYWRFRPYVGAPTDIIFKKIFPPHGSI